MSLPSAVVTSIILFSVLLFIPANGSSMSSLVTVACQRDPTLSFCKSTAPPHASAAGVSTSILRASSSQVVLSENDKILLEDIAAAVQRAGGNPFEKRRVIRQERKDSDLREKEEKEEGFIAEEEEHSQSRHPVEVVDEPITPNSTSAPITSTTEDTEEVQGFKGEKAEYCDNYEQHFSFYCVGEHSSDQENAGKFCKSYKRACPGKKVTTGTGITQWPADPFTGSSGTRIKSRGDVEVSTDDAEEGHEVTEQELYYAELKKRFPCKPDCDPRVFPHCTAECKCDYIYPTVQRFCNPPPMPLFLNTCRLWYHGCPKYDSYHYASQFIYSKAEKGKVLPGIANNVNPYGIPQPALRAPFRTEGAATQLRPLAHAAPTAREEILFIPPPLPPGYKEKIRENRTRSERIDVFEEVTRRNRERRRRRRISTKKRSNQPSAPAPPTKRELYRTLKALSALTADPTRLTKDIIGQGSAGGEEPKPRAYQGIVPVVPSDAAYGAGDDPFRKFDGLTDSRGILHRPRSSSPFTKPGLWAANPDDPHNRDHANKYFYNPKSVGVDWLNGQIQWGAHWAVPAAQVGGTDGFSTVHFPTIGNFLNIPDDYD